MPLIKRDGTPVKWEQFISTGCRVYIGSNASVPNAVVNDLLANIEPFHDVEIVQLLTISENRWAEPAYQDHIKVNTLFIGGKNVREAVAEGRADYTPCFLSEVPSLFKNGRLGLDVALVSISPPDEFGYCSLGISVDCGKSATENANYVVAQINPSMPRTSGNCFIHMDDIDAYIEQDEALVELTPPPLDQVTEQIGQYVSFLIENGATLQLGIGKIPDAVLACLGNHKDLGIHTEMLSDGAIDLMRRGVINNQKKTFFPGKAVTSFCMGTQRLYDFVHQNPHIEFHPTETINNPMNIAKNDNMISINSAIEVDLTGQVVSDSIGYRFYSGIGGQVDFIRGAALSEGGRPIIAMPSTAKNGKESKIVPHLKEGAGVVTSRGDVHFVVTEYGIASLRGKSVRERALELIRIAHPKFRDELLEEVRKHYWVPEYQTQTPSEVPELGAVQLRRFEFDQVDTILRPLNPADERRLQKFLLQHNRESLQIRESLHLTKISRRKTCNLVSVDQSKDMAVCFSQTVKGVESFIAIGLFYRDRDPQHCLVDLMVKESKRSCGVGKALLEFLMDIARQRGFKAMRAIVPTDKNPTLYVLMNWGFNQVSSIPDGETVLEYTL